MDDYKELCETLQTTASLSLSKRAAEAIERLSAELYEANLAKFERGEMLRRITSELQDFDALKEELAALKSASAEPVAWVMRHKNDDPNDGRLYVKTSKEEARRWLSQFTPGFAWLDPLYLHPAPAAEPEDAKDAALKVAKEALESCTPGDYSTGHVISPSFDEPLVEKAIAAINAAVNAAPKPPVPEDAKDAAVLAKEINNLLFANGAPLGGATYFEIRKLCCDAMKEANNAKP